MRLLIGGELFYETLDLMQSTFCHVLLLPKNNVYCSTRSPTMRSAHCAYWRPMFGRDSPLDCTPCAWVPPLCCAPAHPYLMTSSAWNRRRGEIVRPRAVAVLRLMTSSNRVGCSTGRSPGLAPCRILCTEVAARRQFSGVWGP